MLARFFLNRPIFSTVLSLVILLAGLVAMNSLPISQYPNIIPPEVQVRATYPGASPEVIAQTVAAPLEQQINGVDRMLYMRSTSAGDGSVSISVVFAVGTDPDQATINVNNRVQSGLTMLPEEVRRQGVTVSKKVVVGGGQPALSNRRLAASSLAHFIYPAEKLLEAREPIRAVSVQYPPRSVSFLGIRTHWLIWYLIVTFVLALALKNKFGVEF